MNLFYLFEFLDVVSASTIYKKKNETLHLIHWPKKKIVVYITTTTQGRLMWQLGRLAYPVVMATYHSAICIDGATETKR